MKRAINSCQGVKPSNGNHWVYTTRPKVLHDPQIMVSIFRMYRRLNLLWAEEVERRSQEIESGKARLIPGEEVFAKIKIRFGK